MPILKKKYWWNIVDVKKLIEKKIKKDNTRRNFTALETANKKAKPNQ